MKPVKTLLSLAVSLAITGTVGHAYAQTPAPGADQPLQLAQLRGGSISGRVINDATGSLLPYATVRIAELNREASTGRDGQFLLSHVPPGSYTLVVSYQGMETQRISLEVETGAVRRDVRLSSPTIGVEQMLVLGRAEGYASSINTQRNAPSVRTVVSADALGHISEGNIGDALVRLPGMSVEVRAGVLRTATIRGLAPQYNTVTVDGLRMTNVDGNRDIALDSFPANMLARVDVIKAPTPDMSADAIGGTVDLVTRSAYDRDGRILEGDIGTTYNDNRGSWNQQGSITFGDTFGDGDRFGALATLSYFRDERGYDVIDTAYTVNNEDQYFINRSLYYDRDETKDKVGAGLALDFRPTPDTSVYFRGIYHYDYRELWRRGTDYRPNPDTRFDVTPDSGSSTNGRIDSIVFFRDPKNVFQMYTLGGEHRQQDWVFDARAAYSRAKKDYPDTVQIVNSFNNVDMTYDRSNRNFPTFAIDNNVDITDPSGLQFRQYQTNQVPRLEEEVTLDANLLREFYAGPVSGSIKTGVRGSFKESSQAQPETIRYTGLTGIEATDLLEHYRSTDFMSESGGRAQLLGFYPDWRLYTDLHRNNTGNLTQNAGAQLYTQETIANADFAISEDIIATYLMGTLEIDQWTLLAGVRYETTRIDAEANEVVIDDGQVTEVNRVNDKSDYGNVLPSLHLRYQTMDDRLVLRSSISKAISRPPPGDLIPSKQENAQLNQRVVGNPNLVPAESLNIDLTAEYYLPPLGVISAGLFYKDIDNFVFSTSRIASDGVDERTRVNGDGGTVRGLELVWVQQFSHLPGWLSGFGVEANYTWMDSEGKYPNRDDSLPFIRSPDYIINTILSYAQGPFSARVSMNKLPERLEAVGGRPALDRYNAASTHWDLAFKYRATENFDVFFNIKNLTNEPTVLYQGSPDNPTSAAYYGTQYNMGVQFSF